MPSLVKVHFLDASAKVFRVERDATARALADLVAERLELHTAVADYCLYEVTGAGERALQDGEKVVDIYESFGEPAAGGPFPAQSTPDLSATSGGLRRGLRAPKGAASTATAATAAVDVAQVSPKLVYKRAYFTTPAGADLGADSAYRDLTFSQAVHSVTFSPFPLDESSVLGMGALSLHVHLGPYNERAHRPGCILNSLSRYVPKRMEAQQPPQEWEKGLLQRYKLLDHNMSREDAQCQYLTLYQNLPLFGTTFFPCKYVTRGGSRVSVRVLLGVSFQGVTIFEPPYLTKRGSYRYINIYSWGCNGENFSLRTDETAEGLCHNFATDRGQAIAALIQGYIVRILAQMEEN